MPLGTREMARALSCAPSLVSRYKGRGMPMDCPDTAREWLAGNVRSIARTPFKSVHAADAEGYQASRARREAAEAALAELRLASERDRLVDQLAFDAAHARFIVRAEQMLAGLTRRLPLELAGIADQGVIERLIDARVRAALQRLARAD